MHGAPGREPFPEAAVAILAVWGLALAAGLVPLIRALRRTG